MGVTPSTRSAASSRRMSLTVQEGEVDQRVVDVELKLIERETSLGGARQSEAHTCGRHLTRLRLRQPPIMRSSNKTRTAIPVPLVAGMSIAKKGSYLLETVPT
jgi:hypothetical protein